MTNHAYRLQRGAILKIADKVFGGTGVSDKVISLTLTEANMGITSGVLRGHCEYLKGKGYVEIMPVKGDLAGDYLVSLTPMGVDLLEGNIPKDPGVEV